MKLLSNPVFQEGFHVYFTEGRVFMVYFFYLSFLALLQCLVLFLPTGDPRIWMGPAYLFKITSVATLPLLIYFILRIANQEFASWRFQSLMRWFKQEKLEVSSIALAQISLLCLHALLFLLLSLPLFGWAGAVEHAPIGSMFSTLSLLFFYALTYGVWGLFALAFWDHSEDSRRVFVRCLLVGLLLVSGLLYLALNPIAFLLRHLEVYELLPLELGRWRWEATTVHVIYHCFLLLSGLGLYGWALKRIKETYS